jgi:hypothetical protein
MAGFDVEGPVLRTLVRVLGRLHDEATVEAADCAETLRADLMTDRARHAIGRGTPFPVVGRERQVRKQFRVLSAQRRHVAGNRHVADRAFVFDRRLRFRMIDRLASDARLPVRIARRVGHHARAPVESDRHVVSGRGQQPVVAGDAAIRRAKLDGPRFWAGPGAGSRIGRDEREPGRGGEQGAPDVRHQRHPSRRPPSNQSHRK